MDQTPAVTPSAIAPEATVALLGKLRRVHDAVQFVEKRGHNTSVGSGYKFAQALDVVRDLRAALLAEGIIVIPGAMPASVAHHTETGGKSFVTTVDLFYRFTCTETGAMIEVPWVGAGADIGGEKGLYKAYTGGLKYVLLTMFLLPMTDDPEHDGLTSRGAEDQASAPTGGGVAKDAERPAAPRIPLDRARLIAETAVEAGLAKMENDALVMSALLKAQLETLGVSKIGLLNSDQAEALDAFIVAEVQANAAEVASEVKA